MRHIQLESKSNDTDWTAQFVDASHYDQLFDEEVFVRKPNGDPLLVLLKGRIPIELNSMAWSALKSYNTKNGNRYIASGIEGQQKKRADGSMSKQSAVPKGWEVVSGVAGFFERSVRYPYCHPCGWNQQNPEKWARVVPLAQKVSELYREYVPERWAVQKEVCDRTVSDYVIPQTVFTTITMNMNFRTSAHKDAGDLPEGFSCLSVIREGKYSGGHLVFPNYRVAVELRTGDLILFDPHEFHGNTMIVPISPKAKRMSLVYYYRELMQLCLTPAEELAQAQKRKPGDPLYERTLDSVRKPRKAPPSTT